jgi:hypothetical protein
MQPPVFYQRVSPAKLGVLDAVDVIVVADLILTNRIRNLSASPIAPLALANNGVWQSDPF